MKKLILLLLFPIFIFAQDSTTVVLTTNQARLAAKDITKGEFCEKQLKETEKLVVQLEDKVKLKDDIIQNSDEQKELLKKINLDYEQQLKKEKNKGFWNKVLLYGSICLNVLLGIKLMTL